MKWNKNIIRFGESLAPNILLQPIMWQLKRSFICSFSHRTFLKMDPNMFGAKLCPLYLSYTKSSQEVIFPNNTYKKKKYSFLIIA